MLSILWGCSKKENPNPANQGGTTTTRTDTIKNFSVSSVLQSNMVVQRDKPFVIWGNGPANLKVSVNVSWNNNVFTAVTDSIGNWHVTIPATVANANPQTIIAKAPGFNAVTLNNILIGDVWICSGQSNMIYPVDSIAPFDGVINFRDEIAAANYPMIRTFTLAEDNETVPQINLKSSPAWLICSPTTVGTTSAVGYYFARKLNITLNVPVGIIVSAVNGSYGQDWANAAAIQSDPTVASYYYSGSSVYYNGMINPLINLSIKGFTWYQGENNQADFPVSNYTLLNSVLIEGWRTMFNQPQLPFYLVQLTPFAADYYNTSPVGGDTTADYLALFREAQANVRSVNNTGMAVTMDVGEADNHHPRNKKPVGERLALLALNYTYGESVQCVGPQYASFTANQSTVVVNFVPGTANGLNTINNDPLKQLFFVAGPDGVFRQGQAGINGNTIVIAAPQTTPLPIVSIRYAFTNSAITNLQNSAGLPAEPFRTDNATN
jgi:sialate O-acetylesterase